MYLTEQIQKMNRSLEQRHNPRRPGITGQPNQHHCRNHICDGKIFDFRNAQARGQHDEPAASFEVVDHRRGGQREDQLRAGEEYEEDHRLRDCYQRHRRAQGAGEDHRREDIQDGLGDQDAVVTAHAGDDGPIDARAARAEQNNGGYQKGIVRSSAGHELCQLCPTPLDAFAKVGDYADDRSQYQRQHHGGHVLHQYDGGYADTHGAYAEDLVQLLLEIVADPVSAGRSDDAAQRHGQHVANHANGHTLTPCCKVPDELEFCIMLSVSQPSLVQIDVMASEIYNTVDIKVDARKRLFQFVLQHGDRMLFNPYIRLQSQEKRGCFRLIVI